MFGIVGWVGVGKLMIMKLILCEFDQYEGYIIYGGYDIKQYVFDSYLLVFGYVF